MLVCFLIDGNCFLFVINCLFVQVGLNLLGEALHSVDLVQLQQ